MSGKESTNRRKVLKTIAGTGTGALATNALMSQRVLANKGKTVTVSMDRDGWTESVPKGWYNRVKQARRAKDRLKDNHLSKDGVIAVEYSPGRFGGDNPRVIVTLDRNSDEREKRRGEIPERSHQTRVDIEEGEGHPHQTREAAAEWLCDQCDDPCDNTLLSDKSSIPGGVRGSHEYGGTLTSQAVTGSDHTLHRGWMTNAHVVAAGDHGDCGNDLVGKSIYHGTWKIGEVAYVSHKHDFVYIESNSYTDPEPHIVSPESHDIQATIEGTLTADAIDIYGANRGDSNYRVMKYGAASCYSQGYVHRQGAWAAAKRDECRGYWDGYDDQVSWGDACDIDCGDSGSLAYVKHPRRDYHLGLCINISFTFANRVHGTSGDAIRNHHNMWWDDF